MVPESVIFRKTILQFTNTQIRYAYTRTRAHKQHADTRRYELFYIIRLTHCHRLLEICMIYYYVYIRSLFGF